jgi:hypothetical protein
VCHANFANGFLFPLRHAFGRPLVVINTPMLCGDKNQKASHIKASHDRTWGTTPLRAFVHLFRLWSSQRAWFAN